MKKRTLTLGLDFGTNSVRALLVDVADGGEVATAVCPYETGEDGIILDPADPNLARQNPAEYVRGTELVIRAVLAGARKADRSFDPNRIIGLGVDTTGSTPLPVDNTGTPLSFQRKFKKNPNAQAWLWKDHTGHAEAAMITELAAKEHPEYLAKCGGTYSSEWFFSKIFHCLRVDPGVFEAALIMKRSRCAAGHKAMFRDAWGGLPAEGFLAKLHPKLGELRRRLYGKSYVSDTVAGKLTPRWAGRLRLPAGIPVAVGAFDAHLGAIGSGVRPGRLIKIIGTSTCDIAVWPNTKPLADIPGLCGIVDGSVLPGCFGLEAGQSAVGDIFNWFVGTIRPGGLVKGSHSALTAAAARLRPGVSGLLALDWNNGNRTILVDQRLTGLVLGQTLHTTPAEIYRALVEATAFGALTIVNRFEEYGVKISEVINCGGIAEKNALLLQIYADVMGREMKIARSSQTCALGSAIAAAVVAGKARGGYDDFESAQAAMCGGYARTFRPRREDHAVYKELYKLYAQLHDAFGTPGGSGKLYNVMKDLLAIRERQRRSG
jgi:L-ribulokinase